jgi:hypothetical protein
MILMLATIILGARVIFSQDIQKNSADSMPKSSLVEMKVIVKINGGGIDNEVLENLQTILQQIDGVPYVGVNYLATEVTVRYDSTKVSLHRLRKLAEGMKGHKISVAAVQNDASVDTKNWSTPELSNVTFEYLHHDEARALCERHFNEKSSVGIDLESCYVVKVDFQRVVHVSTDYEWFSNTCVVDEDGQLIKPLSWLDLSSEFDKTEESGSGLLILPRIPLTGLALTMRLLRVNGEGYDSFTINVPQP